MSVDSGKGGIAFGTSSQTVHSGATHVDRHPIHYDISFGDALVHISRVERFVTHSNINHRERRKTRGH